MGNRLLTSARRGADCSPVDNLPLRNSPITETQSVNTGEDPASRSDGFVHSPRVTTVDPFGPHSHLLAASTVAMLNPNRHLQRLSSDHARGSREREFVRECMKKRVCIALQDSLVFKPLPASECLRRLLKVCGIQNLYSPSLGTDWPTRRKLMLSLYRLRKP